MVMVTFFEFDELLLFELLELELEHPAKRAILSIITKVADSNAFNFFN
jgi:hypothetical protein